MMRQRFKQWVSNTEYILNIQDGAEQGAKIMARRRMRNNFQKWLSKVKAIRRAEHILKKADWFTETRAAATRNDVF